MNIDRDKTDLMIVNPDTCKQFDEIVVQCNVEESWVNSVETRMVFDVDTEVETEIIVKERDQTFFGPGIKWIPKIYRKYCDFDVVERMSGTVMAEARYIGVTSRIG